MNTPNANYIFRYSAEEAINESNRCLNCKNPKCVLYCPLHNDIPMFIAKIKENDLKSARMILDRTSGFSDVCSFVCYSEQKCMLGCVRNKIDCPVNIKELEKFVAINTDIVVKPNKQSAIKVCVIGAGPSGLAFSKLALEEGYQVDIYDKNESLGGLLKYAIPSFRLPREQLKKIEKHFFDLGLNFINKEIRNLSDVPVYDYYIVATGTSKSKSMDIFNVNSSRVFDWMEFLNFKHDSSQISNSKVCIIGGGNVAIDCSRVARRLNCDVSIIYRRTINEMPANDSEIKEALDEGVKIIELRQPIEMKIDDKIHLVTSVMELSNLGDDGRKEVVSTTKNENFEFDYLIKAIGSETDDIFSLSIYDGKIQVDSNFETSINNVFAIGDCVMGPNNVTEAISLGRKVFEIINNRNHKH